MSSHTNTLTVDHERETSEELAGVDPPRSERRVAADFLRTLFFGAVVVAVGLVAGLFLYDVQHSNQIYEGVSVAGVDIGGMTRSEARDALRDPVEAYQAQPVILTSPDEDFQLDLVQSGVQIDIDRTVDEAFAYGRSGSLWTRSADWASALVYGFDAPVQVTVDEPSLYATLASIAPIVTRPAINAYVTVSEDGSAEIVPELPGYALDVGSTAGRVIAKTESLSSEPVSVAVPLVEAEVRVGQLESGLAQVQAAIDAPLVVRGLDQFWGIREADVGGIISVVGETRDFVIDENAITGFVESIAQEVDRGPKDGSVAVGGNGTLTAVPATVGVTVQVDQTRNAILGALTSGVHMVDLSYTTQQPEITDEESELAASEGEAMLSRGVELTWKDGKTTLERGDLLAALTIRVDPAKERPFTYGFDGQVLEDELAGVVQELTVPIVEPILRYVDGEITIATEGSAGQVVNIERTISNVTDAALDGSGSAQLVLEARNPTLSPAAIEDIYLEDVLAEASTYYGDSSGARRQNVERASTLESGWLIAPGEEFSYAEYVGLITEENGFVTGFGIVDDPSGEGVTTAPVIGGGICQVSTTIFQASFWAGLPTVERYSHPYWIQAYGEPPRGMQGLDAMVNIEEEGSLDLRFTNTTGNWIAIEVVADGTTVSVKILGTDPGWTVDVSQPIITSIIEPDLTTRYTESPELPDGQQLQVEYAQEGFSAEITRVITDENGDIVDSDSLVSSFAPSQNTILEGVGSVPDATAETDE